LDFLKLRLKYYKIQKNGPVNIGGSDQVTYLFVGSLNAVPEPSTWLLLSTGLVGLVGYQRRRKAA